MINFFFCNKIIEYLIILCNLLKFMNRNENKKFSLYVEIYNYKY